MSRRFAAPSERQVGPRRSRVARVVHVLATRRGRHLPCGPGVAGVLCGVGAACGAVSGFAWCSGQSISAAPGGGSRFQRSDTVPPSERAITANGQRGFASASWRWPLICAAAMVSICGSGSPAAYAFASFSVSLRQAASTWTGPEAARTSIETGLVAYSGPNTRTPPRLSSTSIFAVSPTSSGASVPGGSRPNWLRVEPLHALNVTVMPSSSLDANDCWPCCSTCLLASFSGALPIADAIPPMIDDHSPCSSTLTLPAGSNVTAGGRVGLNHSVAMWVFGSYARSSVPSSVADAWNRTYSLTENVAPSFFVL